MVKTEPNFNINTSSLHQHLSSPGAAVSQQPQAAENSQQSGHDVVVELQQFVASSAENTTAAQIILVCLSQRWFES